MPHDDLCPRHMLTALERPDDQCHCALIGRVRADERARAYPGREVRSQLIGAYAQLSHAEAVAAKLVEMICDRESDYRNALWELGVAHDMHDAVTEVLNQTRAEVERALDERDAARVEVAALREQYVVEEFIDTDGYPSMRVVKGEHVGQNEWAANIRREVLADLRAAFRQGGGTAEQAALYSIPYQRALADLRAKVKRIRVAAATNNAGSDVLHVLDEVLFALIEEARP